MTYLFSIVCFASCYIIFVILIKDVAERVSSRTTSVKIVQDTVTL